MGGTFPWYRLVLSPPLDGTGFECFLRGCTKGGSFALGTEGGGFKSGGEKERALGRSSTVSVGGGAEMRRLGVERLRSLRDTTVRNCVRGRKNWKVWSLRKARHWHLDRDRGRRGFIIRVAEKNKA